MWQMALIMPFDALYNIPKGGTEVSTGVDRRFDDCCGLSQALCMKRRISTSARTSK